MEPGSATSKREEIRRKVEASRADLSRPATPGQEPPDGFRQLAMDYPFALVVGGIVLGFAAGALFPRAGARRLVRGAAAAASIAGELGLTYGRQALDKTGETVGDAPGRLEDIGAAVREGAAELTRSAARIAAEVADLATSATRRGGETMGDLAESAGDTARQIGSKVGRQAIKLRSGLRH